MLTAEIVKQFAQEWIQAWNSHDLDLIVEHYSAEIVFSSPFVASIGTNSAGCVTGREALRAYFKAALDRFPDLQFKLRGVFRGNDALTIVYDSVNSLVAAETMILDDTRQAIRVWAQYDRF